MSEPLSPKASQRDDVVGWHTLSSAQVTERLGTDSELGLSDNDAAKRLATDGPNRLDEKPKTPAWRLFVLQYNDFMIYVLLVAVAISAFEGQVPESIAILAILLLNGVLGFVQEFRAEKALDALQQLSAPIATVIRGGAESDIPAEQLVAGDVVLLEAGDKVPADGRLVEAAALRVVESALTGESKPARKHEATVPELDAPLGDRRDMVFAGTSVAVGRGRMVVTGTGQATEMGKIADLLAATEDETTPLQKELATVGKRIAILVLVIAAIVFFEEAWLEWSKIGGSLIDDLADPAFRAGLSAGLLVAVSLAVAAIPEGLPAIVTVSLSLGVRKMAERNAIVRKLHAVETLGSTTFICSDKTGTLTKNEMTVKRLLVGLDGAKVTSEQGVEPDGKIPNADDLALLLEMAATNNDARITSTGELVGDPTETALLVAAKQLAPGHVRLKRVSEVPFDSERKRMTTIHQVDDALIAYTKGGADVVLALCTQARVRGEVVPLSDETREAISAANSDLASSGYRTLAFAVRELASGASEDPGVVERDLTYVGILGLVDPPREEVRDAIAECHRAGIHVAMVTGDHALTARAIAADIGLLDTDRVVTGQELEVMTDDELASQVGDIRVFARVNPEHKLRIVDALKRNGEIVAMTGDGVNDAPALKRADIGIAMGKVGTDVAREAADMVLSDDNFATIVHAVEQGRVVFDNLRKVILFLLSCNMSEVLVVFITAFFSPTAALLPLQLLWINLVTDGLPALALGVDPGDKGVMDRTPRNADESILSGRRQIQILWQGVVMTGACLALYYVIAPMLPAMTPNVDRTMLFTALVLTQLLHAFSFRSETQTVWSVTSLANRWLVLGLLGSMALQCVVIYLPAAQSIFRTASLSPVHWLGVVLTAFAAIAILDATKLLVSARERSALRDVA
jgi:Ca2+-transporting ATPase